MIKQQALQRWSYPHPRPVSHLNGLLPSQLQPPPPWHKINLVRHARAAVGNAADTAVEPAAAAEFFGNSPPPSKILAMIPSWSCSALDIEGSGTRGWGDASSGTAHGYRDHRRAFSDGHYRGTSLLPSMFAPLQGHRRGPSLLSLPIEERGPVGSIADRPHSPPNVRGDSYRWQSHAFPPVTAAAGVAAPMTNPRPPTRWDLGTGRRRDDGEARLGQGGRGLASGEPGGGAWSRATNLSRDAGAYQYTGSDHDREFCHEEGRLPRAASPPRGQRHPHTSWQRTHGQHHGSWRQGSTSPPAGNAVTPPGPEHRSGGDSVENGIVLRPLLPAASGSAGPPSRLPGLAEVVAIAGDRAAGGGRGRFTPGVCQDRAGRNNNEGDGEGAAGAGAGGGGGDGDGGGGGGALEWGKHGQQKRYWMYLA